MTDMGASWHTDIDARIEELETTRAYDGNKAAVGPDEMISALQEIKRLRAKIDNPWFEVGDVLGEIEHGDYQPFCGGYFGRDDYETKRVVDVQRALGGGDSLLVEYPNGTNSQVTVGSFWSHPTFPDRETALHYRVPKAKAQELGL